MIQVIIDMLRLCTAKDKIIFPFSSPEWYKHSLLELKSDEGQIRPIIFFTKFHSLAVPWALVRNARLVC